MARDLRSPGSRPLGHAPSDREASPVDPSRGPAAPYGIIDPDYARVFTIARCLAWQEGYALLMHGSFTRDLDLLAVPWTDRVCEPEHLVLRVEAATGLKIITPKPGAKPHGRLAWTLAFTGFGDPRFVDIGVMPPAPSSSALVAGGAA